MFDFDQFMDSFIWKSGADLNSIIQAYMNKKDIIFSNIDNNEKYTCNMQKDNVSSFIDCVWKFDVAEFKHYGKDIKIKLYFLIKMQLLTCYTMDGNLNVIGIRPASTFSTKGLKSIIKDLCSKNIRTEDIFDRIIEEYNYFSDKESDKGD